MRAEERPVLLAIVDVEEEFDWDRFDRRNTRVETVRALPRAQAVYERHGVTPTYLMTYPVATRAAGCETLRGVLGEGRAIAGAHLHPWVNPPDRETVSVGNSFPGNLAPELEADKIARLTEVIEGAFGVRPRAYQAGRHGIGAHTPAILAEHGYTVDFSVSPPFDYSAQGGPDYGAADSHPFWFGPDRALLGLPTTGGYVGWWPALTGDAHRAYRLVKAPALRWSRLEAVCSRLRALERVRLTPEGFTLPELQRLTRGLLARGVRVFTCVVHSPSFVAGHTPFARTSGDVEALLARLDAYLGWFLGELGGRATTPEALRDELRAA